MDLATLDLSFVGAFAGGLLTFASPCVLPLVPIYLGLLAGDAAAGGGRRPVVPALGFALGLGAVFVALGLAASGAARFVADHRPLLTALGGGLVFLLGLKLLGVFRLGFLEHERRPLLARLPRVTGFWGGLAFGTAFAVGWTPCVGPILGTVLTYAASTGADPWQAAALLSAYAAGLGAPLVAFAAFAPTALRALRRLAPFTPVVEKFAGAALVAVGLLLVTDRLSWVAATPAPDAVLAEVPCDAPGVLGCAAELDPVGDEIAGAPSAAPGPSRPELYEFVGERCPTCARVAEVVTAVERACGAEAGRGVRRVVIERAEGRVLARRHAVNVVPTFISVDADGRETWRHVGAVDAATLRAALGEVHRVECGGEG